MRRHIFKQLGDALIVLLAVEIFDDGIGHIIVAPTGAGETQYPMVAGLSEPRLGVEFYVLCVII